MSSYRTYEEWKLTLGLYLPQLLQSSYRTYEEWKPRDLHKVLNHELFVLTVPMRNGNKKLKQ